MAPFKFLAAICLAVVAVSPSSATVFLAGDSTTANDQGTAYTGWGSQLGKYLSVSVSNNAVAGKSSRSFTDQGYCNLNIHFFCINDADAAYQSAAYSIASELMTLSSSNLVSNYTFASATLCTER